ncbi:MAG: potassium channel family protein [Cyanobacteriota bacterium]|nr:potassium channel family protein [Cyanobacteriota bacterium]
MASWVLPPALTRLTWLGYPCICVLLMAGLTHRPAWGRRWGKRAYLAIGAASIVAQILWVFNPRSLLITGLPLLGLFLVFISWSLVRLLGRLAREVPSQGDLLAGGLAGYLLLGIHGGLLLTVIDSLVPGSFRDTATGALVQLPPLGSALAATSAWDLNVHRIMYFAFVSLTTVGYGDIAPTEPLARLASVALSVLGPFYIAVVIAVVVSRYLQAPQPPQL